MRAYVLQPKVDIGVETTIGKGRRPKVFKLDLTSYSSKNLILGRETEIKKKFRTQRKGDVDLPVKGNVENRERKGRKSSLRLTKLQSNSVW